MKESGATNEELSTKADELIESLTNPEMKAKAEAVAKSCKVVFGVASRRRRTGDHSHVEKWKEHLTWLTQEQKDELKALKEGGATSQALRDKVMAFYDAATGDVKTAATAALKEGCRHHVKHALGDEKAAEIKTLKESGATDAEIAAKIDADIANIADADKKTAAQEVSKSCKTVWGIPSRMRRGGHDAWKAHLTWLTQAQKDELKALKEGGADFNTMKTKVWEYYEAATGEVKTEATAKLQDACRDFIKKAVGDEKAAELKTLKESGATNAEIVAKVDALIATLDNPEHKAKAEAVADSCKTVFGVARRRRTGDHSHVEKWKEHLTWLTQEQKDELKALKEGGATSQALRDKVMAFYEAATGDVKTAATASLKEGCRHHVKHALGDEKATEIKTLKESGATDAEIAAKIDADIANIADADKKTAAQEVSKACKTVWGIPSRKRRGGHDAWKAHLTWLTQEQKDELKALKEGGADFNTMKSKVWEYYEAATGEVKTEATAKLQDACRDFIKKAVGDEKAAELKTLKESGATNAELVAKVDALIATLDNPEKKAKAEAVADSCKIVFGVARRRRTDHSTHEGWKEHLTWLTQEQKDELKALKEGGATRQALREKIMAFYEAATGDVKTAATTALQEGCRHHVKHALGDEKAAEIKTLKESGATDAEIAAKIDSEIANIADATKKTMAEEVSKACKIVYGVASRMRRGGHDAWKAHLTWLTQEQKDELKALKEGGADFNTLKTKVWEYYEAATGEVKVEATAKLQDACRDFIKKAVGDEKAAELKTLKESGATNAELVAKVDTLIASLDNPEKKAKAEAVADSCKIVFGVTSSRLRRNEPAGVEHAEWAKKYLTWLTQEQKDELKALREGGATHEALRDKVMAFYEAATGDVKKEATAKLQDACRSLLVTVVGPEKAAELKALKDGGATKEELHAKAQEFLGEVTDADHKKKAEQYTGNCQKVFAAESRMRRNEQAGAEHAEWAKKYLTWLTQEQKDELKALREGGATHEALRDKVMAFYEATTGDVKKDATAKLQDACRSLLVTVVGPEKAAELKALKDGGATKEELHAKAQEFLGEVTDADKKTKAEHYTGSCQKVFAAESRVRRNQASPTPEEAEWAKKYLTWLTQEQKDELKALKDGGATHQTLRDKVMEFYEALTGDVKKDATTKLQEACRHVLVTVLGPEKAAELKALKEGGATKDDLHAKAQEFLGEVTDEEKKKKAEFYTTTCKQVFAAESRMRRNEQAGAEHAEWAKKYLTWLTQEQKDELKALREGGATHEALRDKVMAFYEAATGDVKKDATVKLQDACRSLLVTVVGPEKAAELKALKDGGATKEELHAKAQEFLGEVTDADHKKKAEQYTGNCRRFSLLKAVCEEMNMQAMNTLNGRRSI